MDAARWQVIGPLLEHALGHDGAERDAYLRSLRDRDAVAAAEVERLLRLSEDTALERGAAGAVQQLLDADADLEAIDAARVGSRVGPFLLERMLGSGGMGAVYLGRRADGEFEQLVAVKLLRETLVGAGARARFQQERDLLAQLVHPNIAQLLDGGASADGLPYFTMEYVEGQPINAHCRAHATTLGAKLVLLTQVVQALAYAHRNLVVHRDIKPSNVLVTADGMVKLLDFGIAKVVSPSSAGLTLADMGPMTPEYAAPEQFNRGRITVATDIYQFGVLMFSVLTGRLPYRSDPSDPESWARSVSQERPSNLSRVGGAAGASVRRRFPRDLESIVSKCLEKNPADRYASADALLADLDAFRGGFPVTARNAGAVYRARRFVQRNRVAVAAAALATVALLLATATSLQQARIAAREAARGNATADFLERTLRDLNPNAGKQTTPTQVLAATLDGARERLDAAVETDPIVRARVLVALGDTYAEIGENTRAIRASREAYQLLSSASEPDYARLLFAANTLSKALHTAGDDHAAVSAASEAIARSPHDDPAIARRLSICYHMRSNAYRTLGDRERAAADLRTAVALLERLTPDDLVGIAPPLAALALTYRDAGQFGDAAEVSARALTLARQSVGEFNTRTHQLEGMLAMAMSMNGELAEARKLVERAQAGQERIHGRAMPGAAQTHIQFAYVALRSGELDVALEQAEAGIAGYLANEMPSPNDLAWSHEVLGRIWLAKGDARAAAAACARAEELANAKSGEHPFLDEALDCLAASKLAAGELPAAHDHAERALRLRIESLGPEHPATLQSEYRMADIEAREGRRALALERLARVSAPAARRYPPTNADFVEMERIRRSIERASG